MLVSAGVGEVSVMVDSFHAKRRNAASAIQISPINPMN
jgi:hypothetical protein